MEGKKEGKQEKKNKWKHKIKDKILNMSVITKWGKLTRYKTDLRTVPF